MSKHLVKAFGLVATALVAVAMMAPAAQAAVPRPGYEQFAGCPSRTENPLMSACVRYVLPGGHIQLGKRNIPISNPITLNGGVDESFENFAATSKGGLEPVKEPIPGGLIGSTGLKWLSGVLNAKQLSLYAVLELAGTPVPGFQELQLPVKMHLISPILGDNCYVGSNSVPIFLDLTTGTTNPPAPNKPITGSEPVPSFDLDLQILELFDGIGVDNSFAAPGASGCVLRLPGGLSLNVSSLWNAHAGLPARAGTNEAVVSYMAKIAPVDLVYSPE